MTAVERCGAGALAEIAIADTVGAVDMGCSRQTGGRPSATRGPVFSERPTPILTTNAHISLTAVLVNGVVLAVVSVVLTSPATTAAGPCAVPESTPVSDSVKGRGMPVAELGGTASLA